MLLSSGRSDIKSHGPSVHHAAPFARNKPLCDLSKRKIEFPIELRFASVA